MFKDEKALVLQGIFLAFFNQFISFSEGLIFLCKSKGYPLLNSSLKF